MSTNQYFIEVGLTRGYIKLPGKAGDSTQTNVAL